MGYEPYIRSAMMSVNFLLQIIIVIAQVGIFIKGCDHAFLWSIVMVLCGYFLNKMDGIHEQKLIRMGL